MPKYSDPSYSAASALSGSEYWACVQGGATKIVTATQVATLANATAALKANNLSDLANAGTARTNLGLAIGTNVQAYSANLTTFAGIAPSANVQTLLGAANYGAFRTSLSLVPGTDVQAYSANLAAVAALSTTGKIYYLSAANTWTAVTIGTGLDFTTGTLSATGFAGTGAITGSGLTMSTARLLGRTTASTGAVEELTAGQGLSLSAGSLKVADATFQKTVQIQVTDPAGSGITTGDGKAYFRVDATLNGLNLVAVAAALTTVSSSGIPTIQIANVTDAVDMLSTKLTVDANETDSSTAASAAVIDGAHDDVATADMLRIDIDVAGTGAKGLIVSLTFG